MTSWLIIRTDHRKEAYVAAQIRNLTFDAWVPCQLVAKRICKSRAVTAARYGEPDKLTLLPRRLFAAVPKWAVLQGELGHIQHLKDIERNSEQEIAWIPDSQIKLFRDALHAENTAAMALAQSAGKKQKARWRSLHDALVDMIQQAKGQLEQAA